MRKIEVTFWKISGASWTEINFFRLFLSVTLLVLLLSLGLGLGHNMPTKAKPVLNATPHTDPYVRSLEIIFH